MLLYCYSQINREVAKSYLLQNNIFNGLLFNAYWLRDDSTRLKYNNCTLCHTVFMFIVFVWEKKYYFSPI
jgi:hypothetical protein